jgi:addiction module RelB/DinJ family antitoxin
MRSTAILRARIDRRRKARVEKILDQLDITPAQPVNMFYAQIERRRAIPFPVAVEDNSDVRPPIEHVARVENQIRIRSMDFRTSVARNTKPAAS